MALLQKAETLKGILLHMRSMMSSGSLSGEYTTTCYGLCLMLALNPEAEIA